MAALSRILTIDPTGAAARLVRSALEVADRAAIQIHAPSAAAAYDEFERAPTGVVVCALVLGETHGVAVAIEMQARAPGTIVIVVADAEGPAPEDMQGPYLYLRRPLDGALFLRALLAAIDGEDVAAAIASPGVSSALAAPASRDYGSIPSIDLRVAQQVIDNLIGQVQAMTVLLVSRDGTLLLERGAANYMNNDQLIRTLLPTALTTIEMSQQVSGQTSSLHFYDGTTYDVFVLSTGYHHFMCLLFDGQSGRRAFGVVNGYGRRAAEDLIAPLGASAFRLEAAPPPPPVIEAPAAEPPAPDRNAKRSTRAMRRAVIEPLPPAPRVREPAPQREAAPPPPPEPMRLEPVGQMDMGIFDQNRMDNLDFSQMDDLFDPDKLAQIASETMRERGPLTFDEAREMGLITGDY